MLITCSWNKWPTKFHCMIYVNLGFYFFWNRNHFAESTNKYYGITITNYDLSIVNDNVTYLDTKTFIIFQLSDEFFFNIMFVTHLK